MKLMVLILMMLGFTTVEMINWLFGLRLFLVSLFLCADLCFFDLGYHLFAVSTLVATATEFPKISAAGCFFRCLLREGKCITSSRNMLFSLNVNTVLIFDIRWTIAGSSALV